MSWIVLPRNRRSYGLIAIIFFAALTLVACNQTSGVTNEDEKSIAPASNATDSASSGPTHSTDGESIYQANCASCHGIKGEGEPNWKSPKEDGTYPAPPHTVDGHTWHHGDGTLFQIIKGGGDSLNIPNFESNMPGYEQSLSDDEIVAVLDYIKTLWPEEQRQFQSERSLEDPIMGS